MSHGSSARLRIHFLNGKDVAKVDIQLQSIVAGGGGTVIMLQWRAVAQNNQTAGEMSDNAPPSIALRSTDAHFTVGGAWWNMTKSKSSTQHLAEKPSERKDEPSGFTGSDLGPLEG